MYSVWKQSVTNRQTAHFKTVNTFPAVLANHRPRAHQSTAEIGKRGHIGVTDVQQGKKQQKHQTSDYTFGVNFFGFQPLNW